jgi:hypothetical protein
MGIKERKLEGKKPRRKHKSKKKGETGVPTLTQPSIAAKAGKKAAGGAKEVRPEEVIPLDDKGFEDF